MEIGTLVTNGTGRRKPGLNDIYAVPLYVVLFIVQRIFVLKICNSAIYCAENFRCAGGDPMKSLTCLPISSATTLSPVVSSNP
jgi:hypothetical protein